MATGNRAVTATTLGAWLIKASPDVSAADELIQHEFSTVTHWCLRRTYRAELVEPDQPVLFWISGSSQIHPAGIYAEGVTTGHARADVAEDEWADTDQRSRSTLVMPVRLRPLAVPVLRSELLGRPSLAQIEVLKMAAGSNPSFVTRESLAVLRAEWPQVTVT